MKIRSGTQVTVRARTNIRTYLGIGAGGGAVVMALILWGPWGQQEKQASHTEQEVYVAVEPNELPQEPALESIEVSAKTVQQAEVKALEGQTSVSQQLAKPSQQSAAPPKTQEIKGTQSLAKWGAIDFKLAEAVGKLSWDLETMRFAQEFTVESSLNNKNFHAIGTQKANTALNYTFDDEEVAFIGMPRVYYRLRMKGMDNRTFLSPVKVVEMPVRLGLYGFVDIENDQIGCFYAADNQDDIDLSIENESGQVVHQGQVSANRDTQSIWIEPKDWQQGNYTLFLRNEETEFRVGFTL